jgi:hypothetical protein
MITQEYLKSILSYDPETGIFIWKISKGRVKENDIAGNIHKNGYVNIKIDGLMYRSHRIAWIYIHGNLPNNEIDHINGIKNDNRIINLRQANHSENQKNCEKYKTNKSGFKGVSWDKSSNKWTAQAQLNGKKYNLGRFVMVEQAAEAYKDFAIKHHGDFCNINLIKNT